MVTKMGKPKFEWTSVSVTWEENNMAECKNVAVHLNFYSLLKKKAVAATANALAKCITIFWQA